MAEAQTSALLDPETGEKPTTICTRCIMDSTVPHIHFNDQGVCNYCTDFFRLLQTLRAKTDFLRAC